MEDLAVSGVFIGCAIVIISALSGCCYYQTREMLRETSIKKIERKRNDFE